MPDIEITLDWPLSRQEKERLAILYSDREINKDRYLLSTEEEKNKALCHENCEQEKTIIQLLAKLAVAEIITKVQNARHIALVENPVKLDCDSTNRMVNEESPKPIEEHPHEKHRESLQTSSSKGASSGTKRRTKNKEGLGLDSYREVLEKLKKGADKHKSSSSASSSASSKPRR